MADFYSAFSCGSCCALAVADGKMQLTLCCENKQPCCKNGRGKPKGCKRCCGKKKRKH
jgi:hypothetical protein